MLVLIFALCAIASCDRPIYNCIEEFMSGPHWPAPLNMYTPSDLNLVSFGGFNASTGDVEGRVAIRDNAHLGDGFSIGLEVHSVGPNRTDNVLPYSLIVGNNLHWGSGALYPDGSVNTNHGSPKENMYVGGALDAPSYLAERRTGGPCQGCLDKSFDGIRPWYVSLGKKFASAPTNLVASYSGGGIFLTSGDQFASRYYVHIDAKDFSSKSFITASGVNVGAEFIITITGGDVTFSGGDMPSISERTVYNIVGNHNVYNIHNIKGSLLAPYSTLIQTGGDQIGFVVVGDVKSFVETRKPFCNILCCIKYGPCQP